MKGLISIVLVALLSKCAEGAEGAPGSIMRKESSKTQKKTAAIMTRREKEDKEQRQEPASLTETSAGAYMLTEVSDEDRANATVMTRLRAHATSMAQMRHNFRDLDQMITELEHQDVVIDGFVQDRVSMDERVRYLRKAQTTKSNMEVEGLSKHNRTGKRKAHIDEENANFGKWAKEDNAKPGSLVEGGLGGGADMFKSDKDLGGLSGFWAEDRPHQLRLDPSNMKVYSFGTFKLRHPGIHNWVIDGLFKKLPLVPKSVSRNTQPGGAQLLDESGKELVFHKNKKGYWFQGRKPSSAKTELQKMYPQNWQSMLETANGVTAKREAAQARFKVYANLTESVLDDMESFMAGGRMAKENNREAMEGTRANIAAELGLKAKRSRGRSCLRVEGATGTLAGFNLEIQTVSVLALKQAVAKVSKVPVETQSLYYGINEMEDDKKAQLLHGQW